MDAAATANYKQLKIQSGALNRYTKELKYYMKELTELKAKLDEMRNAAENDEKQNDKNKQIEIKQQRQSIEETENVIRDIRPKLVKTWETVDQLMNDLKDYEIPEDDDKNKNQNDQEKKETLMEKTKKYLE